MHPFLVLGGLMIAKKAVVGGLFAAGSQYGWARVYRRALEALPRRRGARNSFAGVLARAMRAPGEAAAIFASRSDSQSAAAAAVASQLQRAAAAAAETPLARATPLVPGVTLASALSAAAALRADDVAKVISAVVEEAAEAAAAQKARAGKRA